MSKSLDKTIQPVLVLSANPAFTSGVAEILRQTRKYLIPDLRFAASAEEALAVMAQWLPELLIVDRDDPAIALPSLEPQVGALSPRVEIMLATLHPSGALIIHDRHRSVRVAQTSAGLEPGNDQPIPPNGVTR